jgi:MbtH protein
VTDTAAERTYRVVVNNEEQYSFWEAHREPPEGWRPVEFTGSSQECLDFIGRVWTDMRPLSVRELERVASGRAAASAGFAEFAESTGPAGSRPQPATAAEVTR